jgi:hypothetical protein
MPAWQKMCQLPNDDSRAALSGTFTEQPSDDSMPNELATESRRLIRPAPTPKGVEPGR